MSAPAPVAQGYVLPSARQVISNGFELAVGQSRVLRRASIQVGLLIAATYAPTLVFGLVIAARGPGLRDLVEGGVIDPGTASDWVGQLVWLMLVAVPTSVAISIDAQATAVALLAGRHVAAPLTLRQAVARARQVFWSLAIGLVVVGLASTILQQGLLGLVLRPSSAASTAASFAVAFGAVIVLAPFGYLATGIVLGDVGPVDALRRSVRLTRARPSLALLLALFAFVASALQVFALSTASDLIVRASDALHLGAESGVVGALGVLAAGLAVLVAVGSLVFTMAAIIAAPQVVAFLGLTHVHRGLDRVRDQARPEPDVVRHPMMTTEPPDSEGPAEAEAPAGPRAPGGAEGLPVPSAWARHEGAVPVRPFRWVTVPMLLAFGLEWLLVMVGLLNLTATR